jgi:parallel beta-helix repeat protein
LAGSSERNIITENNITLNDRDGVALGPSKNNVISKNNIAYNGGHGIYLGYASNNSIFGNTIANNYYGIYFYSSSNNILRSNSMLGNRYNFGVVSDFINDVDASNTVDGKPIYYWINARDMVVPKDAGCVILVNSTNITVEGLELKNNEAGILLANTNRTNITQNSITNNRVGIYLYNSFNNSIERNVFVNNGLFTFESYNNIVLDNLVNNKPLVYLEDVSDIFVEDAGQVVIVNSTRIRVENLDLSNATIGVQLLKTRDTTISRNRITANEWSGIYFKDSLNNTISRNNITENGFGIELFNSSDNRIYHNNFINNTWQVAWSRGYANVWDDGYPSGGNYWSHYTGVDLYSGPFQNETGSDGIGDLPYTIDANNVDRYPLMNPWSPLPVKVFDVICEDVHYPVSVQSNSTVTHFIFNQTLAQISFNVSGSSGTWGYCNVTIPKSLMTGPWSYTLEGDVINMDMYESENETHTFISLKYKHASTFHMIIKASWVIPEFSSTPVLILLMLTTLITTTLWKTKRKHQPP